VKECKPLDDGQSIKTRKGRKFNPTAGGKKKKSFMTSLAGIPQGLMNGVRRPAMRGRPVFGQDEFKEVMELAIPALGSLLADPLMSLIDTAAVGHFGWGLHSSTFQLNLSALYGIGGARWGYVARVEGV